MLNLAPRGDYYEGWVVEPLSHGTLVSQNLFYKSVLRAPGIWSPLDNRKRDHEEWSSALPVGGVILPIVYRTEAEAVEGGLAMLRKEIARLQRAEQRVIDRLVNLYW